MAAPRKGIKKMNPSSIPQNAPYQAPAHVTFAEII
jgi:hypothetical protein